MNIFMINESQGKRLSIKGLVSSNLNYHKVYKLKV